VRKLAWGLAVCGVFVLGATSWSSWYAARHPQSILGRAMHGASFVATKLSPAAGFGPVVSALKHKAAPAEEVHGIPDDPVPVEQEAAPAADAGVWAAPIVIPDDDDVAFPVTKPAIRTVGHEAFDPETECPVAAVCRAPAIMPPCSEEDCEVAPMPAVEEEELPMPVIEEQEEAVSIGSLPGEAGKSEAEEAKDAPKTDECREDPHHYHHSVCPATGRSSRDCMPQRAPACDPPKPADDQSSYQSALKTIKRYKAREAIDEGRLSFPRLLGIDTMELRASDRQLYDYGPGAL